jgi:hypothetical protein
LLAFVAAAGCYNHTSTSDLVNAGTSHLRCSKSEVQAKRLSNSEGVVTGCGRTGHFVKKCNIDTTLGKIPVPTRRECGWHLKGPIRRS